MTRRLLAVMGIGVLATATAVAQEPQAPTATQEPKPEEEQVKREEVVVVTASKIESTLNNAPATMSVVTSETLASAPSQNFGDILRNVPGMNVIQMSARDINLTSRQATSTLANSQLVLLDGRTIYLDFFGLVLWDLVPSNPSDIKQIEVVRGPASAVWGANALTGVVNIITKTPREGAGGSFALSGGLFERECDNCSQTDSGQLYGASLSYAGAPNDTWSYRIAGGYFNSDPYSRPTGRIPVIADPRVDSAVCNLATGAGACLGGAPYPADGSGSFGTAFENSGTSQPKVDLRVDQDFTNGGRLTYSAGYAGTEGVVHTGIGPFDLQSGSFLGYGRLGYGKGALRVALFGNFLDADAPNLLNLDPATLKPVELNFTTQTFDFEIGHSKVLGGKHILSYGGNARRNSFEITLAPRAEDRNEFGGYFQWEYFADKFRLTAGGRVDKFGNIDDPVFSPRITGMFKPTPSHTIRLSYNKAFRSPSAINNFINQDIFSPTFESRLVALAPFAPPPLRPALALPFRPRIKIAGGEEVTPRYTLKEESLTAYEISYAGTIGERTSVGIALYQNDSDDNINFTFLLPNASFPQGLPGFDVYTTANAPAVIGLNTQGQAVPGVIVPFLAALPAPFGPIRLPRTAASYLNLGPLRQRGAELSLDHRLNDTWNISANYSYQDKPEPLTADAGQLPYLTEEITLPAKNRFNASLSWNNERFVGVASVNYSDEALWTDVLNSPFHGFTDSYAMMNATFGVKWGAEGRLITSLKGVNLLNEDIQQHIFGDILKRSLSFELRYNF